MKPRVKMYQHWPEQTTAVLKNETLMVGDYIDPLVVRSWLSLLADGGKKKKKPWKEAERAFALVSGSACPEYGWAPDGLQAQGLNLKPCRVRAVHGSRSCTSSESNRILDRQKKKCCFCLVNYGWNKIMENMTSSFTHHICWGFFAAKQFLANNTGKNRSTEGSELNNPNESLQLNFYISFLPVQFYDYSAGKQR